MSMIKAVQCNAEQLAGRVIKKDSRSHPPQFRDPHWNQNPKRGSFLLKRVWTSPEIRNQLYAKLSSNYIPGIPANQQ